MRNSDISKAPTNSHMVIQFVVLMIRSVKSSRLSIRGVQQDHSFDGGELIQLGYILIS